MTYTKAEIEAAAQDLEECASTWAFTSATHLGQAPNHWCVYEDAGLARSAVHALDDARVADDDFDYGCTYRMLEAAALLREGWLPGDPLVRL